MNNNCLHDDDKVTEGLIRLPCEPDCNYVRLIGTVDQHQSLEYTPRGEPVMRFVMLTNVKGERLRHRVVVYGDMALRCFDTMSYGQRVMIEGRSKTRFKEVREGIRIFITEVISETVELL